MMWIVWMGIACTEGDPDPSLDLEDACLDQCTLAADGEGCDTEAIVPLCPGVCNLIVSLLSEDCTDAYETVLSCEIDEGFVCDGSFDIEGVDWPVLADGTACAAVDDLYNTCIADLGSG